MEKSFSYNYKAYLFDKFTVFINSFGELEIANSDYEMVLTHKFLGTHQKVKRDDFINMIKLVFPDRKEQKHLLIQMFND